MQEDHRQAIQNNFSSLVERTDLNTVVSLLYEKGVFSEAMIEPYKDNSKEVRDRKRQLYRDLERRGPKAFQCLIDTLTEIGNWDLVRALQPSSALHTRSSLRSNNKDSPSEFNSIHEGKKRNKLDKENMKTTLSGVGAGSGAYPPDYVPTPEPSTVENPHFEVVKSKVFMEQELGGRPLYRMRSRRRGVMLIFSFIEFQDNIEKYRRGADVDCANLSYLFNEIGFRKVVVYRNLKKPEMVETISALDHVDELENVECVFVVVSSHGYERRNTSDTDIRCSDGGLISTLTIIERFNNNRCPRLRNVPKIFIFQMCRGNNMDLLSPPRHMAQPEYRPEADHAVEADG